MFTTIRQLLMLAARSKKIWMLPVMLALVIVALLIAGASSAPVPLFLYPLL